MQQERRERKNRHLKIQPWNPWIERMSLKPSRGTSGSFWMQITAAWGCNVVLKVPPQSHSTSVGGAWRTANRWRAVKDQGPVVLLLFFISTLQKYPGQILDWMFEWARPSLWQLTWCRRDLSVEWTQNGLLKRNSKRFIDNTKVKQRQEESFLKAVEQWDVGKWSANSMSQSAANTGLHVLRHSEPIIF